MPLNIGTGNFRDYVKYNSKSDKWYVRADGGDQEIDRPTFVADLANIATGWLRFREGQAPERRIDPSLDRMSPAPSGDHKRGFMLLVYSQQFFGGAVEFSSASAHVGRAVCELHLTWEAGRDAHPGELPVVACTGSQAQKDRYGTNYRPIFAIVKWVQRPDALPDASPVDPADVWRGDLPAVAKPRPVLTTPQRVADLALQTEF
jgi:hypothetical protein